MRKHVVSSMVLYWAMLGICSDHSGTELTSGKTPSGKVGYYAPSKNCGIVYQNFPDRSWFSPVLLFHHSHAFCLRSGFAALSLETKVWKPYVILETLKDSKINWNDIAPWRVFSSSTQLGSSRTWIIPTEGQPKFSCSHSEFSSSRQSALCFVAMSKKRLVKSQWHLDLRIGQVLWTDAGVHFIHPFHGSLYVGRTVFDAFVGCMCVMQHGFPHHNFTPRLRSLVQQYLAHSDVSAQAWDSRASC